MKYIIALGGEMLIDPERKFASLLGDWNPNGRLVKVSDEDYDFASEVWTLFRGSVVARSTRKDSKGRKYLMQLHRLVAQRVWTGKEQFDHTILVFFKNGDRYDMRRENLEIRARGANRNRDPELRRALKEMTERINAGR
ncbi:MAG: hypothetical protein Q8K85_15760 [Hyphomicrobium sp.]|nr:hypothetical protein [Hyphomicrobium sp.]